MRRREKSAFMKQRRDSNSKLAPNAADAAAPEPKKMPAQYRGYGPQPPPESEKDTEKLDLKPRWSEQAYTEGAYTQTGVKKPFWGDGDQCFRVNKQGRMKKDLKQRGKIALAKTKVIGLRVMSLRFRRAKRKTSNLLGFQF